MRAAFRKEPSLLLSSLVWLGLLLTVYGSAYAQQLPIKHYTTADGLARDRVTKIRRDSRGFLWFCTAEGLSRFDGYQFTNYTTAQGLPHRAVWDLLESRDGTYWVATLGGLCRFNPAGSPRAWNEASTEPASARAANPMFTLYRPEDERAWSVSALFEDRAGSVWCGTGSGAYRLEREGGDWRLRLVDIGAPKEEAGSEAVYNFLEDRHGALWIATRNGLYRRRPDGRTERYASRHGLPSNIIRGLLEDADGSIWVGTSGGVSQLKADARPDGLVVAHSYGPKEGLAGWGNWLLRSAGGRLWIGSSEGLYELLDAPDRRGRRVRFYSTAQGLSSLFIWAMAEDRDGNLWLGTNTSGVMKMARNGFTTWRKADGLGSDFVIGIAEDRAGELCVTSISPMGRFISRFDGERYVTTKPLLPAFVKDFGAETYQNNLQDRLGEWWIPTGDGLFRYPGVRRLEQLAQTRPKAFYRARDGLGGDYVFRLFGDARGDIWVSALNNSPRTHLSRWERATGKFHHYSAADGLPEVAASAFCEDASGRLWIAFNSGHLARYEGGRFTSFKVVAGSGRQLINFLYCDRAGRLWVGTSEGGVRRADNPQAAAPAFSSFTTADGLSSNEIWGIAEDRWNNVYLATGGGLDRLNPVTKQVRRYTTADGLASNFVQCLYPDRQGALWIGSQQGVSRFIPEPDPPASPSPALIGGLRLAGRPYPLSELGETDVTAPALGPDQNQIQVSFFGLNFGVGERLRYQYKLEGGGGDWSKPSSQHTVDLANLKPGSYRFLVRAVSTDGTFSPTPASVAFRVLPPVWQRWWFITLVAVLVGSALVAFGRYRLARTRELEAALDESRNLTEELTGQRAELRRAHHALELEYAVTRILAESATPAEAARRMLHLICESAGWQVGAIWNVDPLTHVLRCADVWHQRGTGALTFEALTRLQVFLPGEGLPGRVLESGQALWITDLSQDDNFPRIAAAAGEGLRSAFAFPVLLRGEVIGVLEFFSHEWRQPDAEQIKIMSTIGKDVGQLIERRRAEEALRESETRFRTFAETASDAIITADAGGTIVFVNSAAEKVFGHSRAAMIGEELTILMPEYLRHLHQAGFTRYQQTGQRHIPWVAVELPGLHRDGREIPLEISFGEFSSGGRRYFTGIARDITERRRAEEALRRSREERLVELERVRRRIATDLHDDIGSSLTQISILSEVIQQRINHEDSRVTEPLSMIAGASRELVDAMSDIVWAINPQKDSLRDLTQRMRRFAADSLAARNIKVRLRLPPAPDAPNAEDDVKLGANLRREVFLIFKEGVNNMVRHSGCTEADIELSFAEGWLRLRLSDNGRGFDATRQSDGHGLASMCDRAKGIGGRLVLRSRPREGTLVELEAPLDQQQSSG